jgi:hypothetical protein
MLPQRASDCNLSYFQFPLGTPSEGPLSGAVAGSPAKGEAWA